jgi:hypothetical protein
MNRMGAIFWQSFFDGLSGAGLFGWLRQPGAPDEFIDSRSLEEFLHSDDFLKVQAVFHEARNQHEPSSEDYKKSAEEFYRSKAGLPGPVDGEALSEARSRFAPLLGDAARRGYETRKKQEADAQNLADS